MADGPPPAAGAPPQSRVIPTRWPGRCAGSTGGFAVVSPHTDAAAPLEPLPVTHPSIKERIARL